MTPQDETATVSRPRNPLFAVLLSGLFPGLGQLYNRERWKGLVFVVAGMLTGFGPLGPLDVDIDIDEPTAGLRTALLLSLPFLAIALWSVFDAYRVAQRNRASRAATTAA